MKRVFCAVMVAVMCLTGFTFSVYAEDTADKGVAEENNTLRTKFVEYLKARYKADISDDIDTTEVAEVEGWKLFKGASKRTHSAATLRLIGDYYFWGGCCYYYGYGVYAMKDGEIFTFEEAFDKGLNMDKAIVPFYFTEQNASSNFYVFREGDTNIDNVLDMKDILNMQKKIAFFKVPEYVYGGTYNFRSGDPYSKTCMADVLRLQRHLAGFEV